MTGMREAGKRLVRCRFAVAVAVVCVLGSVTGQLSAREKAPKAESPVPAAEFNAEQTLVYAAARLAAEGKQEEALQRLDQAIAGYDARFGKEKRKVYAARTMVETLLYMAEAASTGGDAIAVEPEYAYAYYFKAYSLIELGRAGEAAAPLEEAIGLSPRNSQFLSELGNTYQSARDWTKALAAYQKAAGAADFSPDDVKDKERARAWRGIGFVYIELGRLDEAEAMFKKCLAQDRNDSSAANELEYLRQLRAKQGKQ